jgi:signal transduction histidine kinase/integral membrane sensor domain MASE1
METGRSRLSWNAVKQSSQSHTAALVCLVAVLSYLAAKVGGALIVRPEAVWPLWPGCALLVSVLLLVPRKIWPLLIAAALAAFVLYDLQAGFSIRSIARLILADTVEVLTAALFLRYSFDGVPRLNSVKALAKYSLFAVILAPLTVSLVGAFAIPGDYRTRWKISFLSEALAFLTLTPAILGWVSEGRALVKKSRAFYLEASALMSSLVLLGYVIFVLSGKGIPPALLYSLVPFLLWASLRFGSTGVSTSVIVVAFLSIWGTVHGRGPFTAPEPINRVLSLQLFLLSTATPFMVLAALVEERKRAREALQESEQRLRLAVRAGGMYAFDWDAASDVIVRSAECADIFNWMDNPTHDTGRRFAARVHPDDYDAYAAPETVLTPGNSTYQTSYRVLRPDGGVIWLEATGHVFLDSERRIRRIIGMVADVTDRKLIEEALSSVSRRLIEAQERERTRIARELHDDLSQRMALLQIGVEQLAENTIELSSHTRQQLHDIARVSTEVSSTIHNMSHQLHPYKLDTLGLVASLHGFCNEISPQHNLQVQFVHHDLPGQIPKDVALCLFRIVQEALRNVVKHSGSPEATVELSGHGDRIDLSISDSGAGFNPKHAKPEVGLGLISMRERVRLVKGHLSIESEPSHGTRIRVRVPLPATETSTTIVQKAHTAGA